MGEYYVDGVSMRERERDLCVSRATGGERGSLSLNEQSTNRKRAQPGDKDSGGRKSGQTKKLKVSP